ncbi:hypothetical protein [Microlunatus sp. Gsoil 973]|uniref:hypothetical protein n=1 Tax=Microlunatus sp. Gsoil 973 TaxID=2672569 RepID=UPI0012B4A8EF|nr:hypothetical protein [Microlunatus sp. Gsoil 973]QGN33882.1 hypothetical protein GJV80_14875 [Microlunatus sp. Gsoil 973]
MTLWDLVLAFFRRWPVLLVGALITCTCGGLATRDNGVYWTRTQVILLAPKEWYPNKLEVSPWEVTKATGVVVKRVVGAGSRIKYASPEATMIGTSNVRDGTWIRQEDNGGQWSVGLTSPVIIVEAVGPTPERAQELQQVAANLIAHNLAQLQRDWGVNPKLWITSTVAPAPAVIYHVTGSKPRALGMTALLGVGITLGFVLALEYRVRRRAETDADAPESEFVILDDAAGAPVTN